MAVLPDIVSDYLLIFITIPTSPITNSTSRLSSFNYNIVGWDIYLFYIDTHYLPPSSFTTFSLSEATFTKFLNDAAILFGNILLKLGGPLKLQKPLQSAIRHLRDHTVRKKTTRTISLSQGIPLL